MENGFGGIETILTAGGSMVIPILLASIWSVSMLIDGLWQARRASTRLEVLPLIDKKGLNPDELRGNDPVTTLFRFRLENPQATLAELRDMREHVFAKVERRFSWLSTLSAIAPLFGLLGTVFGMIKIFHIVSVTKPTNPIAALSGGISEALIATAGGLIVAVIASLGYHFLTNRFASVEADTERWLTKAKARPTEDPRIAR